MSWLDPLWRRPSTREGRNEQKKAAAAVLNAAAITMLVTGFLGPAINPTLADVLSAADRTLFVAGAVLAHGLARAILYTLEDK